MQPQTNAARAPEAPVEGLLRTRYTLVVCVACGHEHVHTPRQQSTSCPECGASARRSFALFRDMREERQ
jgi:predicted RNA-binding Zn-ribbon protein involved in translation (DUF1610 family)